MNSAEVRRQLVDALVLDLIGPIADPSRAAERLDQRPSRWCLTGFLVPSDRPSLDLPNEKDDDEEDDDLFGSDDDLLDQPTAETSPLGDSDKNAVLPTSKRQVLPSSMGLSVLVPRGTKTLDVTVRWGDYHPQHEAKEGLDDAPPFVLDSSRSPRRPNAKAPITSWVRRQHESTVRLKLDVPYSHGPARQGVPGSDGLVLEWLARPAPEEALDERLVPDGALSVNVYLVNRRTAIHGAEKDAAMAFQAELIVRCDAGFVPRPNLSGLRSLDLDDREADLQYRDICEFAVGHNVSATAEIVDDCHCQLVRTSWIPHALVERVEPSKLPGIVLGMEQLAALTDFDAARSALIGLADLCEAWILSQAKTKADLYYDERLETCGSLLHFAKAAARRIRQGIDELKDPKAFRAFTLAK